MAKSILAGIDGLCCKEDIFPTYAISEKYNPHQEGIDNTFTVTTTAISDGTVLNWQIVNITSSNADFILTSGTVTIMGGSGTFSVKAIEDLLTEGIETYKVNLIAGGIVVATTPIIEIGDYSTSNPVYTITPNKLTTNEGEIVKFNVTATNTPNNTWLQWQLIPVIGANNSDFDLSSGGVEIVGGVGSFDVLILNDLLTEGVETFKVNLKYLGAVKASSSIVTINDTSLSLEGYAIVPNKTVINEGEAVTFKVYTSSVTNGTVLTWNLLPLTGIDLTPTSGSVTINSNYAEFIITTIADLLTEGNETFFIKLFDAGTLVATSTTVTINDTSVNCINPGTGFNNAIVNAISASGNKYIVVGSMDTYNGSTISNNARLNPDGSKDSTWNLNNIAGSIQTDIALRNDGKYYMSLGNIGAFINGVQRGALYVTDLDNNIDTSFPNMFGKFNSTSGQCINSITLNSSNVIYLVGDFTTFDGFSNNFITSILPTGVRNTAFNSGTGFDFQPYYIRLNSLNELVVCGNFNSFNGTTSNKLIILNTDGSIKVNFANKLNLETLGYIEDAASAKHYIYGQFTSYNGDTTKKYLMRFNSDWTVDNTFNYAGTNIVTSLDLRTDGKLIITDNSSTGIKCANTDGTINTSIYSFGVGFNNSVEKIIMNPDNSFMAFGYFSTYKTLTANTVAKISNTGNLDNC